MAGDLIPPPSPAGRPPVDSMENVRASAQLEDAVQLGADDPAERHGPSPFRGRFGFAFGALAGVAVCAAALADALETAPGDTGPPLAKNWSEWKPDTSKMIEGAQSIAAHVGLQYELDDGSPLTQVRSSGLEFQGLRLGVAVRPKGADDPVYLEGDGLLYVLNGLGPNGAVAGGKPTRARGRLLMREALELSLYSFRYLDDVTMVAVLLPPSAKDETAASTSTTTASEPTRAVFYRPGDLLPQLQVPLARTLSPETPTPKTMKAPENARIDSLALRNLFLASVQPLKAEQSYLVLKEPDKVE
jgi:hypothetical protein